MGKIKKRGNDSHKNRSCLFEKIKRHKKSRHPPGKSDFSLISYARLNIFFVLHLEKTNLSSLIWYSSDQISP